jgi:predicted glycosyl hydrolase (DUF1957 family)
MRWINFLHLYQPMNADASTIKEATEKSYYRIVRALEENSKVKFTLNINGCLLMRWDELGFNDIIKRIDKLIKQGKIELTGTAAYHPLLPLIPAEEVKRQIKENEDVMKKYFGDYKPRGFFLPEMAYSPAVAKIVSDFGYGWIILDEVAYNGKLNQVDYKKIYLDKCSGLKVIFRSRKYSNGFPPDILKNEINKKDTFITATDGELYGLRHIDHTAQFEKLLKNKDLETELISEFIDNIETIEAVKLVPCSWESTEKELKGKSPYELWNDKENKIQQEIWKFANLAYDTVEKNRNDKNYLAARWHIVRGLASCTWWWASGRKLSSFGQIAWSPDEVERGLNELIRAVRSLDDKKIRAIKIKAEKLCLKIREELWLEHWNKHWGNK